MTTVLVDLGHNGFKSRKGLLQARGYCTATIKTECPTSLAAHKLCAVSTDSYLVECWIPRVSQLALEFKLLFADQLPLFESERHEIFRIVERSVRLGRIWLDLGLQSSHNSTEISRNRLPGLHHFSVVLQDIAQNFERNPANEITYQNPDSANLQPPHCVSTNDLKAISISIEFDSTTCDNMHWTARGSDLNLQQYSTRYVQLADAVLRSFICRKPMRMFGVIPVTDDCISPLARIIPSTFDPGYTDRLSSRFIFIEPISRLLIAYLKRRRRLPTNSGQPNGQWDTIDDEDGRRLIEKNLWMTMANGLRDEEDARRLGTLEYIPEGATDLYCEDFVDIALVSNVEDRTETCLRTGNIDTCMPLDDSFLDLLIESRICAPDETRPDHFWQPQPIDRDGASGQSSTATASVETISDLQLLNDCSQLPEEITWEGVSMYWAGENNHLHSCDSLRGTLGTEVRIDAYTAYHATAISHELSSMSTPVPRIWVGSHEDSTDTIRSRPTWPDDITLLDEVVFLPTRLDDQQLNDVPEQDDRLDYWNDQEEEGGLAAPSSMLF